MAAKAPTSHPLDPLSAAEIQQTVSIVRATHQNVYFNIVSLHEPRKAEMSQWLANKSSAARPHRMADVCVIAPGGKVGDGVVDIEAKKIVQWDWISGMQPIVSCGRQGKKGLSSQTNSLLDHS